MKTLTIRFIEKEISYTGAELRSHFIYDQFDLLGDALVAFVGPCEVPLDHMVDLEDVKAKSPIYSEKMLHFLGEFYGMNLETTVLYQRLFMAIIFEELQQVKGTAQLHRHGDDIYEGDAKLSVSIATASPVSTLLHAGINISSRNTPVRTKGLEDYRISSSEFAQTVLKEFQKEFQDISKAVSKVRAAP